MRHPSHDCVCIVKRSSTLDVARNKKPAAGGGNGLLGYHAFGLRVGTSHLLDTDTIRQHG